MTRDELIEQAELLMQELDAELDILRKRMDDDRATTDVDRRTYQVLEDKRDDLQNHLDRWQETTEEIPLSEQEILHLKIEDLKMSIARGIQDLE